MPLYEAVLRPAVAAVVIGTATAAGWVVNRLRGPLQPRQVRAPGFYAGVGIMSIGFGVLALVLGVLGQVWTRDDQMLPWIGLVVCPAAGGAWLAIWTIRSSLTYDEEGLHWRGGLRTVEATWAAVRRIRYSPMTQAITFDLRTAGKIVVYATSEGLGDLLEMAQAKGLTLPEPFAS